MKRFANDIDFKIKGIDQALVRNFFPRDDTTISSFYWKIWPQFAMQRANLKFNIQKPIYDAFISNKHDNAD